jgi:hypothetical protein
MQFSLKRLSDFIEQEKNLFVTTMIILMAFYITVYNPANVFAGQWVSLAFAGAGVYLGNRIGRASATTTTLTPIVATPVTTVTTPTP